jgi:hypothetical protein
VLVVIAPDSYGGTLSAVEAAAALGLGWSRGAPHDTLDLVPLSDGGPGFVDVLAGCLPEAQSLSVTVSDPLGRPTPAVVLLHREHGHGHEWARPELEARRHLGWGGARRRRCANARGREPLGWQRVPRPGSQLELDCSSELLLGWRANAWCGEHFA